MWTESTPQSEGVRLVFPVVKFASGLKPAARVLLARGPAETVARPKVTVNSGLAGPPLSQWVDGCRRWSQLESGGRGGLGTQNDQRKGRGRSPKLTSWGCASTQQATYLPNRLCRKRVLQQIETSIASVLYFPGAEASMGRGIRGALSAPPMNCRRSRVGGENLTAMSKCRRP